MSWTGGEGKRSGISTEEFWYLGLGKERSFELTVPRKGVVFRLLRFGRLFNALRTHRFVRPSRFMGIKEGGKSGNWGLEVLRVLWSFKDQRLGELLGGEEYKHGRSSSGFQGSSIVAHRVMGFEWFCNLLGPFNTGGVIQERFFDYCVLSSKTDWQIVGRYWRTRTLRCKRNIWGWGFLRLS